MYRGLQQLKQGGKQVHAQLSEARPSSCQAQWGGVPQQQPLQPRPRATPAHLSTAAAVPARGGAAGTPRSVVRQHEVPLPLEEQCRFQQLEERQLRAEIATLTSKVGGRAS